MYLVVGDHKNRSLMTLLWSWASGKEGYRDMRIDLVEKLGPGTYLYQENELVRRALLNIQWRYGYDGSGRSKLRVMKVTVADVDLLAEFKSPASDNDGVASSAGSQAPGPGACAQEIAGGSALGKPSRVSDLDITPDRRFDALRFDFTLNNKRNLENYHKSFGKSLGDPGPYRCQFSSTTIARDLNPRYICPNDIKWAVLSPSDYYYRHKGYSEGDIVPLEERGIWMLGCTDCVKRVFRNIVFHPELVFVYPDDPSLSLKRGEN